MYDPNADWAPNTPKPSDLVKDALPDSPEYSADNDLKTAISGKPSEEDVLEAMRDVVDPELMINVVDLGLVYGVNIDDDANVVLDMTLTSPACPLTDRIEYDTQTVLASLAKTVTINWVWMPAWSLEMITDDGREQLRAIGFHI